EEGRTHVERVLTEAVRWLAENRDCVRLVRHESLADGSHLGFDLGAALRPYFQRAVNYFERETGAGRLRKRAPEQLTISGCGAGLTYCSDEQVLRGLLGRDPTDEKAMESRIEAIREFFLAALEP